MPYTVGMPTELQLKQARLGEYLPRHNLDGVLLSTRAFFAWATGGKCNRIANSSSTGVAAILLTPTAITCLTNTIEGPRFRTEELAGMGINVVEFDWHDAANSRKVANQLLDGQRIAADADIFNLGLPGVPSDFNSLRFELTPQELDRYRMGGRLTSDALEAACREIKPGMSEHEAAGWLTYYTHKAGLNPVVTLIASDERVVKYRHPIPVEKKIGKYVMLVTCAEHGGLISNCTRFVHFGEMSSDLVRRHQAVCEVDATINLATKPGLTLGELFQTLAGAYEAVGFKDEWKLHHQGGTTGYAGREVFATPGDRTVLKVGHALAWNPSITGTKSEDTILLTEKGIEVITGASGGWPMVQTKAGLARPGMLVV